MTPMEAPAPVQRFILPVVGGTFHVAEVVVAPGQTPGQAVESIRNQPAERWLVMTAALDGAKPDALAFINDAFECQIVALGSLSAEPG